MKSVSFGERLKFALIEPRYPEVGIEFDSDCIRLAVIRAAKGKVGLLHVDSEPLPEGALEVTPFKANINSMESVAAALKSLWSRNPFKSSRLSLVLPDRSALVFNVAMEHAAKSAAECVELLRFKLKKNVPFRVDDASLSYYTPAGNADYSAVNLWVLILNHAVLHQYEQFVQSAIDCEIGLVDLKTLGLMNLSHPMIKSKGMLDKDVLYVNLSQDYLSLAIVQKSHLTSFRTRPLESAASPTEAAMEEIHPTMMYYQDKLAGQGFASVFVHAPGHSEELTATIAGKIDVIEAPQALQPFAGSRFDLSQPVFLSGFAPLAGSLLSRTVEFK